MKQKQEAHKAAAQTLFLSERLRVFVIFWDRPRWELVLKLTIPSEENVREACRMK